MLAKMLCIRKNNIIHHVLLHVPSIVIMRKGSFLSVCIYVLYTNLERKCYVYIPPDILLVALWQITPYILRW